MPKQILDLEIVQKLILETNGNVGDAAKLANVNYSTFLKWLKKEKIPFNIRNKPILATKEELEEALNRLGTIKAVAKELNVSSSGLSRWFKKFGIKSKVISCHTVDDDFFSRDTEEAFYWAGFIAADGCVIANGKNKKDITLLNLTLQRSDEDHIKKFVKDIKFSGDIKQGNTAPSFRVKKSFPMSRINITSRKITSDLKRFGIVPRKSLIFDCPQDIVNHELFNHFLRGYFDGDGSCWINRNQLTFLLIGTNSFLTSCKDILINKVGLKSKKTIFQRDNHFRLEYNGNKLCRKIVEYLYKDSTVYLQRKYDKFKIVIKDLP